MAFCLASGSELHHMLKTKPITGKRSGIATKVLGRLWTQGQDMCREVVEPEADWSSLYKEG